jgi:hypothetical protein
VVYPAAAWASAPAFDLDALVDAGAWISEQLGPARLARGARRCIKQAA